MPVPAPAVPLRPLLDRKNPALYKSDGTTPHLTLSTGPVLAIFFDRSPHWLLVEMRSGRLRDGLDIPAIGENGQRAWTLPDVENMAFALFHSGKSTYDAAALHATLTVVYAVARLHGLLPPL